MDEDYCSMEQVTDRRIFPCAFHCGLDEDVGFLPYEFSESPVPAPDQSFLSALAAYLRQTGLCETIAITNIDGHETRRVERLSPDGQGMIAVTADKEQEPWDKDYTTTEWAVIQEEGELRIVAVKKCDDKEPAHTRP